MFSKTDQKGFTLIELAVVVFIIGAMLFLGLPRFQESLYMDGSQKASLWITGNIRELKKLAMEKQATLYLNIDITAGRLWKTADGMNESQKESARKNAFNLTEGVAISDVERPSGEKLSGGVISLGFYKDGHSDRAVIHMENNDGIYVSFMMEPFLFNIEAKEGYARFGDAL